MTDRIAFDLLRAEAEAFPLSSPRALELGLTKLERNHPGLLDSGTLTLADALNERLRVHAGGLALESLAQLRDEAWFAGDCRPDRSVGLCEYLLSLSNTYLRHGGNRVTLVNTSARADLAARWRWLTLRLPADLLMAAAWVDLPRCPAIAEMDLATPHLDELMRAGPVAETHVHLGNALSFDAVWTGLMTQACSGHVRDAIPCISDGPCLAPPFDTADFGRLVLAAAVARLVLARMVTSHPTNVTVMAVARELDVRWARRSSNRSTAIDDLDLDAPRGTAERVCDVLVRGRGSLPSRTDLQRFLTAAGASLLRDAYSSGSFDGPQRALLGTAGRQLTAASCFDEISARDPLSRFAPPGCAHAELWLLHACLRLLKQDHGPNAAPTGAGFARLVWQYCRLRCLAYGHLTQDPGVSGLDWFRVFSGRLWAMRRTLEPFLVDQALRTLADGGSLAALELRIVPPQDRQTLRIDLLTATRRMFVRRERPELGFIVHFLKSLTFGEGRGKRLHIDPAASVWSYGVWYKQCLKEAKLLESFLRRFPESLVFLRGLDIASTELSVPTFPIIEPIQRVRAASCEVAAELSHRHPDWGVTPMRVTCHAGEDYRRLAEGIRRVHELIDFGVLNHGDRIGHGLAIGHSPELWAAGARVAYQPRGERMADLAWELDAYGKGYLESERSRAEFVRSELFLLGSQVFDELQPSADELVLARQRRHDPAKLRRLGFPDGTGQPEKDRVDRILVASMRDANIVARALVPIAVQATPAELDVMTRFQRFLRREIGRLEITVESNPSSNLLLSSYVRIEDHPAFRLLPIEPDGHPQVLLSINSDDPLTFATCTRNEYAHIYHTLLRRGVDAQAAMRWLEQVRQNGYRSRFTLHCATRDDVLIAVAKSLSGR